MKKLKIKLRKKLKQKRNNYFYYLWIIFFTSCLDYGDREKLPEKRQLETCTTYWKNGNIKEVLTFNLQDKLDSIQNSYNEDGILFFRKSYRNGLPLGEFTVYFESGDLRQYTVTDYNEDVFFVMKWDSIGKIIKQEGLIIGPSVETSTNSDTVVLDRQFNICLIYASPKDYRFSCDTIMRIRNGYSTVYIKPTQLKFNHTTNEMKLKQVLSRVGRYSFVFIGKLYDQNNVMFKRTKMIIDIRCIDE